MTATKRPTDASPTPALDPAEICALPPDDLRDRLAWIRAEILPHALGWQPLDDGLVIELAASPALAEKVDALIERERACCSGIVFLRTAAARSDRMHLEVRGVDPEAEIFRALSAAAVEGSGSRGARLAASAGAGVIAGLVVCCVLPIVAVAGVGAAAAPLAGLDAPAPILATSLVSGATAWWWLGRRRRLAAQGADEVDCC